MRRRPNRRVADQDLVATNGARRWAGGLVDAELALDCDGSESHLVAGDSAARRLPDVDLLELDPVCRVDAVETERGDRSTITARGQEGSDALGEEWSCHVCHLAVR